MRLSLLFLIAFTSAEDFYSFKVRKINGEQFDLDQLRGTISLVVNVASDCGHTKKHYEDMIQLQQGLHGYKFQILAFPCNQFGKQEPGTNEEIEKRINEEWDPNFTIFQKSKFIGTDAHEALEWLVDESKKPHWNFYKWLIGADGHPIKVWGSETAIEHIFEEIFKHVQALGTKEEHEQTPLKKSKHSLMDEVKPSESLFHPEL